MEVSNATSGNQVDAVPAADDNEAAEAAFEQQMMDSLFRDMLLADSPFKDMN